MTMTPEKIVQKSVKHIVCYGQVYDSVNQPPDTSFKVKSFEMIRRY